jgi:hypothetical protein
LFFNTPTNWYVFHNLKLTWQLKRLRRLKDIRHFKVWISVELIKPLKALKLLNA